MAQQPGVQSRTSALMVKDVHTDICITPFEDRVMVRADHGLNLHLLIPQYHSNSTQLLMSIGHVHVTRCT